MCCKKNLKLKNSNLHFLRPVFFDITALHAIHFFVRLAHAESTMALVYKIEKTYPHLRVKDERVDVLTVYVMGTFIRMSARKC